MSLQLAQILRYPGDYAASARSHRSSSQRRATEASRSLAESKSARVSSSSLAPQISTYLRALSHCNQTRRRSQAGSTAQVLERRHRLHQPRQVAFHSRVARSGCGIRGCCGFRLPKVGCPGLAPIRRAFRRATRPRAKRPPAAHTAHCAAHCAACCAAMCGAQSQGPIFRNFTNQINLTNQTLIGPNVLSVMKS